MHFSDIQFLKADSYPCPLSIFETFQNTLGPFFVSISETVSLLFLDERWQCPFLAMPIVCKYFLKCPQIFVRN